MTAVTNHLLATEKQEKDRAWVVCVCVGGGDTHKQIKVILKLHVFLLCLKHTRCSDKEQGAARPHASLVHVNYSSRLASE